MQRLKLFVPLTKVDVEKREVWGRLVQETPDKSGEIFDYETSLPYFKEWSASFEKATDGKSLGNIRAMHGKVAAGKVIAIDFNDADKAIDIGSKIVDDNEWAKVLEGVYTGYSIGGDYIKRWNDQAQPTLKRYTASPSEGSLVDNPCVPTALFTMVKAGGVTETKPFQRLAVLKTLLTDETLSIGDTIGLMGEYLPPDEIEKLSAVPETTMGQVRAALKKFASEAPVAPAPAPVKKGLYSVSSLADCLSTIRYLAMDAQYEAEHEKDESKMPEQLRAWLKTGVDLLVAMTQEESDELLAAVQPVEVLELAAKSELEKVAGEKVEFEKRADTAIAKVAELTAANTTLAGEKATLEKSVTELTAEKTTLAAKVTELEKQPADPKGVLRVVDKAAETLTADPKSEQLEKIDPNSPTFALDVMKAAMARPIHGRPMASRTPAAPAAT